MRPSSRTSRRLVFRNAVLFSCSRCTRLSTWPEIFLGLRTAYECWADTIAADVEMSACCGIRSSALCSHSMAADDSPLQTGSEQRSSGGFLLITGIAWEKIVGSASGLMSFLPHWWKKSLAWKCAEQMTELLLGFHNWRLDTSSLRSRIPHRSRLAGSVGNLEYNYNIVAIHTSHPTHITATVHR